MNAIDQLLIAGLVTAIVKALRTKFPKIDGIIIVVAVAAVIGTLSGVIIAVAANGKVTPQDAARGILSGLAAVGGMIAIDRAKGQTADPQQEAAIVGAG